MPHDSHRKSVHIIMIVVLSIVFYSLRTLQPDTAPADADLGSAKVGSIDKFNRVEHLSPVSAIKVSD